MELELHRDQIAGVYNCRELEKKMLPREELCVCICTHKYINVKEVKFVAYVS